MRHEYAIVDAFTRERYAGNPCAVIFDAGQLDDAAMQRVAREMNLSETAFVVPTERAAIGVRYFTPVGEIPLAGHPERSMPRCSARGPHSPACASGATPLASPTAPSRSSTAAGRDRVRIGLGVGTVDVAMRQRGFTLVELLVGCACALVLGTALLAIARGFVAWTTRTAHTLDAQAALDRLTDRWYAEEATAWAVFTPANDVFGFSNADGHEFDVVTEDERRRTAFLAYVYEAGARRITEFAYGAPGDPPTPTGDVTDRVTAFDAHTYPASDLRVASSPIHDPLFANATVADADVAFPGLGPDARPGNRITRVHVAANRLDRVVMLASGTAPSHFTIIVRYTPAP